LPDHRAARPTSAFFVNAPVDLFCIGGASLALFGFLRWSGGMGMQKAAIGASALVFVLNWPHFAATSFRLYGNKAGISRFPLTALVAPILCAGAVFASLRSPLIVAPVFLKIFLIWSPYHYSGQTVGLTMIYARRTGLRFAPWARVALSGFVFLTYLSQSAAAEVAPAGNVYSGVHLPSFAVPQWLPWALTIAMYACGAVALGFVAVHCIRNRRSVPTLALLPALSQFVWFVPGAMVPGFREFVPAFHSLQYLLVAWSMHLHETFADGGRRPGRAFVLSQTVRWAVGVTAGGALLMWALPSAPGWLGGDPLLAFGVVAAGVQVHHFLVDGVIWKLKSRDLLDEPAAPVAGPGFATPEMGLP
jgi:hypothetical protein